MKSVLDFEMYVWDDVLHGLRLQRPNLIRYPTGDVFHVAIGVERFDEENNSWETIARVSAKPNFPKPYPLWETPRDDLEDMDGDIGRLQKADYLPVPGITVQAVNGYVFHWIENGISYKLTTEEGLTYAESREILASVHKIRKAHYKQLWRFNYDIRLCMTPPKKALRDQKFNFFSR